MTGIKPTAQLRLYGVIVPFFISEIQSVCSRPGTLAFYIENDNEQFER